MLFSHNIKIGLWPGSLILVANGMTRRYRYLILLAIVSLKARECRLTVVSVAGKTQRPKRHIPASVPVNSHI